MWLSYKNNFLFIHIYKVAGVSIKDSLKDAIYRPYDYELWKHRLLRRLSMFVNSDFWPQDHARARQIRNKIGKEKYNKLFKFAFVRNPWDWQVSMYKYMLQTKTHFQHDLVKNMSSFEEYIEWRVTQDKFLQKDFVTDENGEIIVDFIGRFENLESDFKQICDHINIAVQLPHLNKSKTEKKYTSYYNEKCKNLIYQNFKEDINFFGYSFEN